MKQEEEKKDNYELVKVPSEYGLAIQSPNGEYMSTEQAIVEILNILRELKKSVA